jgi:peroxiredoxin
MKHIHIITVCVIVVVLIGLFSVLYLGGLEFVPSFVGQPADVSLPVSGTGLLGNRLPFFDLPDLAGNHVSSTDFTDMPLVIVFWSTWNVQAADEVHILDQYLSDQPSQSRLVKVIAIDSQEELSVVSSFMKRGGYIVETLLDTQGLTSEHYGIKSLPTLYFVDRTGVIREVYSGMVSESTLMNKIEKILQ